MIELKRLKYFNFSGTFPIFCPSSFVCLHFFQNQDDCWYKSTLKSKFQYSKTIFFVWQLFSYNSNPINRNKIMEKFMTGET